MNTTKKWHARHEVESAHRSGPLGPDDRHMESDEDGAAEIEAGGVLSTVNEDGSPHI